MVISPLYAVSRSRALEVLATLEATSTASFNDVKRATAIDNKTLARRLRELEEASLVRKGDDGRYVITPKGRRALGLARELGGAA